MIKNLVPQSKLGTPFQSPSWRYQALYHPERFGLGWLLSKRELNAGYLSRLIPKGIQVASTYYVPVYITSLLQGLNPRLGSMLLKVWNKHFFSHSSRKISFGSAESSRVPISWNLKLVKKYLNDDFLKQLIHHCHNFRHNDYIESAIHFYKDTSNSMNRKWFNYSFYGQISDVEIAKTWKKPLGFVKAVRLLFFDYSHWPKDRIAQFSLIRQMVNDQEIDDPDFHYFRRIYDLGEVGLKSAIGLHKLSIDEARQVEQYLSASTIDNILNLKYTVVDTKSAVVFDKVVSNYTGNRLKKLEIEQRNKLTDMAAQKLARELGLGQEATAMFPEEAELMELLKDCTKLNFHPKYPSFIDIKAENAKITVESPDPESLV